MLGVIPKDNSAYRLMQTPQHSQMGQVNWSTGETWGILICGAAVGVIATMLWNRYYK